MYDYIIVGGGLAGIAFAETALQNNKTVMVYNDQSQISSVVAAGLYNPVILKRFTQVWQANEQLELLQEFYAKIEAKLQFQCNHAVSLLRIFHSIEEQNNWFTASDKPKLSDYLSTELVEAKYPCVNSPLGFGEVLHCGYVDTELLLKTYHDYLKGIHSLSENTFNHHELQFTDNGIQYQNTKAKHIIFAEGYGMHANPFFSGLPLDGAKGELLLIKAPNLDLDVVVKAELFVLPLGNDIYKVGATYNWDDKTNTSTDEAKRELLAGLKEIINCDFEIIDHLAGIRPTVKDRRPMIGTHPKFRNMHLLNGMGTRGVMLAPAMSQMLYHKIENGIEIDPHVSLNRFKGFVSVWASGS